MGSASISQCAETFDLDDLDEALLEIHDRHELFDKRHFEAELPSLDDQAILGSSVSDRHHLTPTWPHLQPDQILWPELPFLELATSSRIHFLAPEPFGAGPVGDPFKCHLGAFLPLTQGADDERTIINEDRRLRFEVGQILRLGVDTEETIQAVGFPQSPDQHTGMISRGTRLQR